jgi:hypothetical protein
VLPRVKLISPANLPASVITGLPSQMARKHVTQAKRAGVALLSVDAVEDGMAVVREFHDSKNTTKNIFSTTANLKT